MIHEKLEQRRLRAEKIGNNDTRKEATKQAEGGEMNVK